MLKCLDLVKTGQLNFDIILSLLRSKKNNKQYSNYGDLKKKL